VRGQGRVRLRVNHEATRESQQTLTLLGMLRSE
jgi:hypothetical protein